MKLVVAQWRMELTNLVRNYEQLLLILVIPVGVLVFFGNVDVLPESMNLSRLVSSVLTLSLMSTAMVSTGISTGFERSYHVLKRLGVTPLGRTRLIWAKAGSVTVVELMQVLVLVIIATILGWSATDASWWRVPSCWVPQRSPELGSVWRGVCVPRQILPHRMVCTSYCSRLAG